MMDTRKAGKLGGKRRAQNMTPDQRSEDAQVASRAYWDGAHARAAQRGDEAARCQAKKGEGQWTTFVSRTFRSC